MHWDFSISTKMGNVFCTSLGSFVLSCLCICLGESTFDSYDRLSEKSNLKEEGFILFSGFRDRCPRSLYFPVSGPQWDRAQ